MASKCVTLQFALSLPAVAHRRMEPASNQLARGYTSTMLGIAGLSGIACVSLLMTVNAISELEEETLTGPDVAAAMRTLRF
jgi:hypothetical protein